MSSLVLSTRRGWRPLLRTNWGGRPSTHYFLSTTSTTTAATTTTTKRDTLPDHANVIIVGGGVIGNSVAYHLGKLGVQDVLLLERDRLTSGTTWHAAGLMATFGSLSSQSMDMRMYTKELYHTILPHETGLETGMMEVGFIDLACESPQGSISHHHHHSHDQEHHPTPPPCQGLDRLHYYRRVAAFNQLCGVNVQEITPHEVQQRFPLCNMDGVLAGFYVPEDGRVNPTDVTMALAKGARQYGVQMVEGVTVQDVITSNPVQTGRPKAVQGVNVSFIDGGMDKHISANIVVNTTGMWARQLGERSGITIPNQAAEHYYLITEPIPGLDPRWPVVEDPSRCLYMRPEGNGLLIGFFEWQGVPWNTAQIPNNFSFGEIEPDWDRMEPYLLMAMQRLVPEVQDVGIKKFFCGPESFTPDNSPVLGPAPNVKNYYVAAGLNSIGILTGGGIGRTLAQWIKNDGIAPSSADTTGIHVNRFHRYQSNPEYRDQRVGEALANTYLMHYPDHQNQTCRGAKKSVLFERLRDQQHGFFRSVSGWETPDWYARSSSDLDKLVKRETFGRPDWFPLWMTEHKGCRENVGLLEMSFMSKTLVQGYDAGKFLNWISTANVDGPVGRATYTQWLNEHGYLEADLNVIKLSETEFLVVTTDNLQNHVLQHMHSRLSREWNVAVTDVTSRYAQIGLQGPRSRELLQTLTSRDLSSDFDFRHAEDIDIGLARALCVRMTYVGELGYELFIPSEQACLVYDQIVEAGKEFGLIHAGLKALNSLWIEKGYRDYGHDIDNTDTIFETGLSYTIDWDKDGGFIGDEHARLQMEDFESEGGRKRVMANVKVPLTPSDPLLFHGEVLWRNGNRVSDIRMGSYGHSVGGGVGLTMLQAADSDIITSSWVEDASWELQIAEKFYPCQVSLSPFYDPEDKRIYAATSI